MEQIDFFSNPTQISSEQEAFDFLLPSFYDVMERNNIPQQWLRLNLGAQYASIMLKSSTIIRLKFGKKVSFFAAQYRYVRHQNYPISKIQDDGFARFDLSSPNDIRSYTELIMHLLQETIDVIPAEFDCCNSFNECSDARECIHPNRQFAAGCGYKRILKSGRVFFGKNRNIDTTS